MKTLFTLVILCLAHLATDGTCALSVLSIPHLCHMGWDEFYFLVILYNIIAFGSLPLCGWILDLFRVHRAGALIGLIITATGPFFLSANPLASVLMLGTGNALFHTGAGALVYSLSDRRSSALGLFIATGAVGLTGGAILSAMSGPLPLYSVQILLGIAMLLYLGPKIVINVMTSGESRQPVGGLRLIAIALIMLVVFSRSVGGYALPAEWMGKESAILLFGAAVFAGKSLGGVLADRFGWIGTGSALLLAGAGMAIFKDNWIAPALVAVVCVQATTGITLAAVQSLFPHYPSFAFGLPCMVILIGASPFLLPDPVGHVSAWIVTALCVIAAAAMVGLKYLPGFQDLAFHFLSLRSGQASAKDR